MPALTFTSHDDILAPPPEAARARELQKRVAESFAGWPQMWNAWDMPLNWQGFPNSGPVYLRGATGTTNDRRAGRDLPLFWTEVDLRGFRVLARFIHDTNGFTIGFMGHLTNYNVRKGFAWQACRHGVKKTPYPTSLTPTDPLVVKGQTILDTFRMANKWPITSREAFLRWRRDGELYGRLFYGGWHAAPRFRFVEPEQIGNPSGDTDGDESFGIRNAPGDVCEIEAFHVWNMDQGMYGGEWIAAKEISYLKANTDSTIKRGLPDLFPVQEQLDGVRRLLRNMIETGIDQANIAWRERFATASADQVRSMVPSVPTAIQNAYPFPGGYGPWGGAGYNGTMNRSKVIRVEGSREFEDGPLAAGVPNYIAIEQACLRGIGARWGMPESFSGDASNANYSSSIVAGSPFSLAVEASQTVYGTWEREVALKVFDMAVQAGLLSPQERAELDVEITEPAVVSPEPDKETNRRKTLNEAGVLSPQTWQLQEQLDPQHEAENWKAWKNQQMEDGEAPPSDALPGGGGDKPPRGPNEDGPKPTPPTVKESKEDAAGHEHKGKGKGGGQFVKKGGGGSDKTADKTTDKRPEGQKSSGKQLVRPTDTIDRGPPPKHADEPIKTSPGLSPEEAKIERDSQEYVREHYQEMRTKYLKHNAWVDPDTGSIETISLNTDEWRDHIPGYVGTNAGAVHEAASWLNKNLLAEALESQKGKGNGQLMVLAGGGGSGKGTATGDYFNQADYPLVLDQVSDRFDKLEDKLKEAEKAGFGSEYVFIDRPPADAWGGVVGRALNLRKKEKNARTVPIEMAVKANIHARKTAIEFLKRRTDVAPNVVDNRGGDYARRLITDRDEAIKYLESQLAEVPDEKVMTEKLRTETIARYHAGEIPKDIAIGLLGKDHVEQATKKPPGESVG